MISTSQLGKLERVNIRDIWKGEASDFTPWLCQADNLAILSDAVGLKLEVQEREFQIGEFRLDILSQIQGTGEAVVIENQFWKTDHDHFGKLLTYAAGVGEGGGARVVIWLAEQFAEPHRSALDWLNRITDPSIRFFGVEIEVWRIGNSNPAPRFQVVCKPNISQKQLSRETSLSATQLLYRDFWQGFLDLCSKAGTTLRLPTAPATDTWIPTDIGASGIGVNLNVRKRSKDLECHLWLSGPRAKSAFSSLLAKKEEILAKLGPQVEFDEMPGREACRIFEKKDGDVTDHTQWPTMHQWLKDRGEAYASTFVPLVRGL